MPEERRLVEEPDQSLQQMVNRVEWADRVDRGDGRSADFHERRKGLDSMPGALAPQEILAQQAAPAADNAAGPGDGAGGQGAPVDYDG